MAIATIKDTIQDVIQALETKRKKIDKTGPEALLKKVLTEKELGHIRVNYFKKGVLGVSVDSSTWLYHFSLKKDDLRLALAAGNNQIKDIRLRLGEVK